MACFTKKTFTKNFAIGDSDTASTISAGDSEIVRHEDDTASIFSMKFELIKLQF